MLGTARETLFSPAGGESVPSTGQGSERLQRGRWVSTGCPRPSHEPPENTRKAAKPEATWAAIARGGIPCPIYGFRAYERLLVGGRYWDRTTGLCRVKANQGDFDAGSRHTNPAGGFVLCGVFRPRCVLSPAISREIHGKRLRSHGTWLATVFPMLRRVLGQFGASSSEDLPFELFEALVADRVREFQHLDYKRALPESKDKDKREFVRDVAAMANGGGGLLVFGIADNKHAEAEAITTVPLAGSAARLRDIAIGRVQPYLSYRIVEVLDPGNPDQGIVVFEVPQSQMRPFAATDSTRFEYPLRSGREKRDMNEADIERLYRERFQFVEQFEKRLTTLAGQAGDAPGTATGQPRAYVAALPFERANERIFAINAETTIEARSIASRNLLGSGTGVDARPSFRHYRITSDGRPSAIRTELHDDGGFVGTIASELRGGESGGDKHAFFWLQRLIKDVLDRLIVLGAFAAVFDIAGDVAVEAGITGQAISRRPVFLVVDPSFHDLSVDSVSFPLSTRIQIDAADLLPGPALLIAGKRLLDDLFTAFGLEGCPMLTSDGRFDGGWFDDRRTRDWAQQNGVGVK